MSIPSIAVIGAGPGGLTLASLLQSSSIPFTIFDLRAKPSVEAINKPSGSLDLHEEGGLGALKACNLYSEFQSNTRPNSEETRIADKSGKIHLQDYGNPDYQRPEIDRSRLTSTLLSSIEPSTIRWEHKIKTITNNAEDTEWTLEFLNRPSQTFNIIIGADGAWSKVRKLLTDVTPVYSGINCITLTIPNVNEIAPQASAITGNGTLFASTERQALVSQRGGKDGSYIRTYAMIPSPSANFLEEEGFDRMSPADIKTKLITDPRFYADWSEDLKQIITASSTSPEIFEAPKPLYKLPLDKPWKSHPRAMLLGDAAHLVTPFAGEGVNAAMRDALELAKRIVSVRDSNQWEELATRYDEDLWDRARDVSHMTEVGEKTIFAEGAPRPFVELMESHH